MRSTPAWWTPRRRGIVLIATLTFESEPRRTPVASYVSIRTFSNSTTTLLALKAAADFGVDLRTHDPARTWEQGYAEN
jgi:hypothetical protein